MVTQKLTGCLLAGVLIALNGFAQEPLDGAGFVVDFDAVDPQITRVSGQVHMLSGAGGNIGVFAGDDGVFLVDSQFAPLNERIQAQIRTVSAAPIRLLINTHFHEDHTSANRNFSALGALLVAHKNVRRTLSQPHYIEMINTRFGAFESDALPQITYDDTLSFHLNGERVDIYHAPPSHTDGDSIIYFRGSNVIHMGDVFRTRGQPIFDRNNGGSYEGLIEAANFVLTIAGDNTMIIPGHGPLSSKSDLIESRDTMAAIRDRIAFAIREGRTLEEVIASDPSRGFDWRDGRLSVIETIEWIYRELAAG